MTFTVHVRAGALTSGVRHESSFSTAAGLRSCPPVLDMEPAAETTNAGVHVRDDLAEKCQKLFLEFLEE